MKPIICIFSKNERESVGKVIKNIKRLDVPFVVWDGHSTDGTIETAKGHGVKVFVQRHRGKGDAIREAMRWARRAGYDAVVFIDCDLTYPSHRIPDLLRTLEKKKCGMVVGRRAPKNIPRLHRLPNGFFNWLVRNLYGCKIRDMLSGLRAIRLADLGGRDLKARGFDIEAEITLRAIKKSIKVVEVPISYYNRHGKSKLRKRDGALIMWRILKELLPSRG